MSNKQIIAAIILIVLIVSVVFVVGLVLQQPAQPNENPQDTTPPIVTILNPADGADLEALVRIDFNATDSNPITEYEIKIDSVTRTNLTSYEWDTTLETDGIHSIVCRAKDNSSNWGEDTISVTVNNTVLITNNAPIVTITAPAAFSTVFYGNVLITSTVVDEESLVANIYIDGEFVNDTGICVINASLLAHGVHSIFANATDSEGLTGSDLIEISVNHYEFNQYFEHEIKIMTYNIEESGINPDWIQVVEEENPDIMILVETGNWDNNNDALLNDAIANLNAYFINEVPYEGYCAEGIAFSTSGEAILSRFPILDFIQIPIVPLDSGSNYDVTHDFIHAIVNIYDTDVNLIGGHLKASSGATNENRREWEMEGVINYMDNLGDVPIIYLGDMNSFSPFDIGPLTPSGNLGYGPITMLLAPDDLQYGQFSSHVHNFTDVFRTLNPTDPGDTGFGSRIDFIFVNDFFLDRLINSTVGDTAHANTGSDHYSVDAFLGWNGTADESAPANVTGLKVDATYATGIDISWNANTEPDLHRYLVYRNGTMIAQVTTTYYNDSGLSTNTTYIYEVSAKDTHGNEGNKSLPIIATTLVASSEELIVLNEFLPDPYILYSVEWIELYNPTLDDVDLGGYILDDIIGGGTSPYTIPAGTIIPSGGFLVFNQTTTGIALNNNGDTLNLIKPDGVTVQDSYTYTSSQVDNDQSIGRETDGAPTWVVQSTPTPGASNTGAALLSLKESNNWIFTKDFVKSRD
jgi:endonuclease/exonuclease/phosphatase family metal-dependent hydrolase